MLGVVYCVLHLKLLRQRPLYLSFSIGVVIIDDHPEVTVVEDSQSNLNDDGFTEVVSKKQQKRLQDEERRKKEEQTVQVRDTSVMQKTFL